MGMGTELEVRKRGSRSENGSLLRVCEESKVEPWEMGEKLYIWDKRNGWNLSGKVSNWEACLKRTYWGIFLTLRSSAPQQLGPRLVPREMGKWRPLNSPRRATVISEPQAPIGKVPASPDQTITGLSFEWRFIKLHDNKPQSLSRADKCK